MLKNNVTSDSSTWKKILTFVIEVLELIIAVFGGVELSQLIH